MQPPKRFWRPNHAEMLRSIFNDTYGEDKVDQESCDKLSDWLEAGVSVEMPYIYADPEWPDVIE